eukprot:CAMPEP_0206038788 /NCGR_PEP_ID=MMETSP1466-20131121/4338_1 /ASSEMBLY_ACC=CAM_ASM_001126 /TAXON_ID=44452 /ORGANISM="Pavlova gyrans, Strain CCMP608" /LENGTH=414 /DNA_ID=CAMNT_0053413395 /DNA_START=29 /DNA_END=1271 /DNA_ORIENTATION=+
MVGSWRGAGSVFAALLHLPSRSFALAAEAAAATPPTGPARVSYARVIAPAMMTREAINERMAFEEAEGAKLEADALQKCAAGFPPRNLSSVADAIEPTTMVCFAGLMRAFLRPQLQWGLVHNLHEPGYEYFISTEAATCPEDPRLLIAPVRAVRVWDATLKGMPAGAWRWGAPIQPCPRGTMNHRNLWVMARRTALCFHDMVREERSRGFMYKVVLRMRTDQDVLLPAFKPDAPRWLSSFLLRQRDKRASVLLVDDRMVISGRELAPQVLLGPNTSYANCAGLERWTQACYHAPLTGSLKRPPRGIGRNPPCCPFFLTFTYPVVSLADGHDAVIDADGLNTSAVNILVKGIGGHHPCTFRLKRTDELGRIHGHGRNANVRRVAQSASLQCLNTMRGKGSYRIKGMKDYLLEVGD